MLISLFQFGCAIEIYGMLLRVCEYFLCVNESNRLSN
jgi:hypothetical protein